MCYHVGEGSTVADRYPGTRRARGGKSVKVCSRESWRVTIDVFHRRYKKWIAFDH